MGLLIALKLWLLDIELKSSMADLLFSVWLQKVAAFRSQLAET